MVDRRTMMKIDNRGIEEIDMLEEYEMIPLETGMYGYDQRNVMKSKGFIPDIGNAMGYMHKASPGMGMYPNMNRCPCMGMNSSMGVDSNMDMNRSMETNASIETSSNLDLHPNMEMDPDIGVDTWMEMSQFNEDMFMSSFTPIAMPYGDMPMKVDKDENEGSRHIDKHGGIEDFKDGYSKPNKFDVKYNDVDSIVRRIERYNPLVFRLLNRCGMPYAQAKDVVRRIVRLTLMYSEE
jgi:hypothetical protein